MRVVTLLARRTRLATCPSTPHAIDGGVPARLPGAARIKVATAVLPGRSMGDLARENTSSWAF